MNVIEEMKQYYMEAAFGLLDFWLYPLGALVLIYLLTLLMVKQRSIPSSYSRVLHILSNLVYAGSIVAAIAGAMSLYFWVSGRYQGEPLQLSHLLSIIIAFGVAIWGMWKLASQQNQENVKNLVHQPKTLLEKQKRGQQLRVFFSSLRNYAWLIPLISLLGLLPFFHEKEQKLICFVIDNSGSMTEELDVGKVALSRTIQNFDENTHVAISFFDNREVIPSLSQITSTQSSSGLAGTVRTFESDKQSAINQINAIPIAGQGSPICELIWKTYLFSRDISEGNNFDFEEKHLVLITDCQESAIPEYEIDQFLCNVIEFDDFFPAANVRLVQLENDISSGFTSSQEKLLTKIEECSYEVLDGSLGAYNESIDKIANEVTNDSFFPLSVAVLYIVYALVLLLLNPKQNF